MGNEVVDFSQTGRPTAAHLASRGYLGVMRYLSWEPNPKNITAAELAALHANGLAVGFVWETTAARSTSGPAGGQRDVIEANHQLDVLGAPLSTVIYMATDFDAKPDQIRGYYQGAVASSKRPVGIYGGFYAVDAMLREGVVHFGWQTYAWSGGHVSRLAQLYQHQNDYNDGGSVDLNNILAPNWGQWAAVVPPVVPLPAPTPVPPTTGGFLMALSDQAQADLEQRIKNQEAWKDSITPVILEILAHVRNSEKADHVDEAILVEMAKQAGLPVPSDTTS